MKYATALLLFFLFTASLFSQRRSRGDRFFEKGDFINAAKQYEKEIIANGYDKYTLQNIATAYFNIFDFKKAYTYLKILIQGRYYSNDKSYDNSYNYMIYQVLSALGEYDTAIRYLSRYQQKRTGKQISKIAAISTIESFKLKENDYSIAEVSFNSKKSSDFAAVQYGDSVVFASDRSANRGFGKKYKWTHRPFLNIFKASGKNLETITPFSSKINSKRHEGNFCFTADGKTMYLSKSKHSKKDSESDTIHNYPVHLYKSQRVGDSWSTPQKLVFNHPMYTFEHPALSADGSKLYFASDMPGGEGGFDIYYVDVREDGSFGNPTNLGNTINTEHREQFPYISPQGHLFFASDGHFGLGMLDIFVSENRNGAFGIPINLGAPINTKFDDFSLNYFNRSQGYFASNRKDKIDNIYSFRQIGEIFPREYAMHFVIKDYANNAYIPNTSVALYDGKGEIVYENLLNERSAFDQKLFPGRYEFKAEAQGYKTRTKDLMVMEKDAQTCILYLDQVKESAENEMEIKLISRGTENSKRRLEVYKETPMHKKNDPIKSRLKEKLLSDKQGPPVVEKEGRLFFKLPPMHFDYGKWNIRADSKKVLYKLARKLEKYKTVHIKISSHTDSRGTDAYNKVLSKKRAEATRNYLALVGYVNARRMRFFGFGESNPIVDCNTKDCSEADHQTNRRSEFEIIDY